MGYAVFGFMPILFFIVFIAVFVMIIIVAVKGISTWHKNNQSPRLTVEARVVTKRADVSHHHHQHAGGTSMHMTTSTTYYTTFEVASGDRLKLHVGAYDYGMLVEGDYGLLSFQGTRFLGFERR